MTIRHLSYVACDQCGGNPAQPGDDARDARAIARSEGYITSLGRGMPDLCPWCRPDRPEHCGLPAKWYAGLRVYVCGACGHAVDRTTVRDWRGDGGGV